VPGTRAVLEALRGPRASGIAVILIDEAGGKATAAVASAARERRVHVEERPRRELDALAGDARHQGALAIVGEYVYTTVERIVEAAHRPALLVALDQITDPHNFGAIVRSAVVFGADGVITLQDRACPVTSTVVRASAGATEHARIARATNLARTLASLADLGLSVVGLDEQGTVPLESLPAAPAGRVVVVGAEGTGLRRLVRERCDILARVQTSGPIRSLNASVAAGIALWEAARQRHAGAG